MYSVSSPSRKSEILLCSGLAQALELHGTDLVRSWIADAPAHLPDVVHIVSHGPHCLDGVTSAVAVARFHAGLDTRTQFATNPEIDGVLQTVPAPPAGATHDLWITDISWTRPETEQHLRALADAGMRIVWIDHHRTAIERLRRGAVEVRFAAMVVEDTYAASRLTWEHLRARLAGEARTLPWFEALERLVMLADDNDRWIHDLPGSRELALTVAAMHGTAAYESLLAIDAEVTYTPAMREAEARVKEEVAATHALADRTRYDQPVGDVTVSAAWCVGYPSEVGDVWGRRRSHTVIALYDTTSQSVSFRRSPECAVDLSRVAETFGGGGHAAAAGARIPGLGERDAAALAALVVDAVAKIVG